MPVRMRLALHGCKNRPFYHIVVAPSRFKRNGRHLEQVGSYDPMANYNSEVLVGLNLDRIKYWLGVGAQPTIAVYRLLGLGGVLPVHPRVHLEARRKREGLRLKQSKYSTTIKATPKVATETEDSDEGATESGGGPEPKE